MFTLRLAIRMLRREPIVTAVTLASLAIGIGANATVFSLVQAVEFPRLIYPDPARLVAIEARHDARQLVGMLVSAPDAQDLARGSRTFAAVSLAADQTSILGEGPDRRRVSGRRVDSAFFEVLDVGAALGRVLGASDVQGAIVIGDDLWRAAFNADPAVVGRTERLDGGVVTVVGVMPRGFDRDAAFWTPLGSVAGAARDDRQYSLFARLAPDAALTEAAAEVDALSRRLADEYPATNEGWTHEVVRIGRLHGRDSRGTFVLLQVAVAGLLLITCANIANLLLARATSRRHELALRLSLGATRVRLIALLLAESLVLAVAGGAAGCLLALWGVRLARIIGGFPAVIEPSVNAGVLAFTAGVSVLTGILCGIVPAWRASRANPASVLASGGRAAASASGGRLRDLLVAAQMSGAVILTTGAALLVQSFTNRAAVDLGFNPRGVILADVAFPSDRYDELRLVGTVGDMLDRLAQRPDVTAAGAVTWALPTPAGAQRPLMAADRPESPLNLSVRRGVEAVTPGYFEAMGIPVVEGRAFTPADRAGAPPLAIVNEELARHLWPDGGAAGDRLRLGDEPGAPVVDVVGVVGTVRRSGMHDQPVARVYVPFAQHPNQMLSLAVRVRGGEAAGARALREVAADTDPALLPDRLRTAEQDAAAFLAPLGLVTSLFAGFGAAALLLSALGVFGTMSYMVSERKREMAVRSALGAPAWRLAVLVLARGVLVSVAGLLPGLAIAAAAAPAIGHLLYGVAPVDPATIAVVSSILLAAALAACGRPARTAAAADPMTILRE